MFHNVRAAASLLLLAANSLELARTLLPHRSVRQLNQLFQFSPRERNFLIVIGPGEVWSAALAALLTLTLMLYHRIVERKKATGECCLADPFVRYSCTCLKGFPLLAVFLYASTAVEVVVFALRTNELSELVYYEDILELQTCLVGASAMCMMVLAALDGFTIYKQVRETIF